MWCRTEYIPGRVMQRGQERAVIELRNLDRLKVEFLDRDGRTYATHPLCTNQSLVPYNQPAWREEFLWDDWGPGMYIDLQATSSRFVLFSFQRCLMYPSFGPPCWFLPRWTAFGPMS